MISETDQPRFVLAALVPIDVSQDAKPVSHDRGQRSFNRFQDVDNPATPN